MDQSDCAFKSITQSSSRYEPKKKLRHRFLQPGLPVFIFFLIITSAGELKGNEIAEIPASPGFIAENGIWVENINDSYGWALVDEWDDFRTFAFHLGGLVYDRLRFSIGYDWLTFRGENEEATARYDLIHSSFALRFPLLDTRSLGLELDFGSGFRVGGNLGGYVIQYWWHDMLGIERPIPAASSYAEFSGLNPFIYGFLSFKLKRYLFLSIDLESLYSFIDDLELAASLRLWTNGRFSRLYTGIALKYASGYQEQGILGDILAKEEGLWFSYGAMLGHIYLHSGINVSSLTSSGYVGFRSYLPEVEAAEEENHEMVLGTHIGRMVLQNKLRWQPGFLAGVSAFGSRTYLYVESQNGWDYRSGNGAYRERFQEFGVGLETGLLPVRKGLWLNPYLGLGIGTRLSKGYIISSFLAEPEDEQVLLGTQLSAGLKLQIGPLGGKDSPFHYGLSVNYNLGLPLTVLAWKDRDPVYSLDSFVGISIYAATIGRSF